MNLGFPTNTSETSVSFKLVVVDFFNFCDNPTRLTPAEREQREGGKAEGVIFLTKVVWC